MAQAVGQVIERSMREAIDEAIDEPIDKPIEMAGIPDAGSKVAPVKERRFYQPELDGLRFYAFLGVFVCHTLPFDGALYRRFHLPLPWLWGAVAKSGASGVDLFFALSAFLITSLLLREREETGEISLRRFYLRRVLRIWPVYFLLISVGVVLAHTVSGQALPWIYVAGYLLFAGNWMHAMFGRPESVCSPLWTVSIEEQFYLIWPLLMQRLRRRGMIVSAIVTCVLANASRIGYLLAGAKGGFLYYGSNSRCDSLALGILLALFADRLPRLSTRVRWLLLAMGLSGWLVAAAWLNEQPGPVDMRSVLGRLVVSLSAAAILYSCLYSRSGLVRGSWVVELGKISYGLYVWHLTAILLVTKLFRPAWGWQLLAVKGVGFVATVILALASYRWIESPFLRLKDKFATVLSRPV
jgi:peptidoglycan/LPS O-acetylase OafA/YrhL